MVGCKQERGYRKRVREEKGWSKSVRRGRRVRGRERGKKGRYYKQ